MEAPSASIPNNITCEACRQHWQKYHDAQGRPILHCPIGYCTIYLEINGQETYLSTARSYADLRASIVAMEPGTQFSAHLNIFMDEIGGGFYTRTVEGVEVREESRAAEGLYLAMCEAEQ